MMTEAKRDCTAQALIQALAKAAANNASQTLFRDAHRCAA